MKYKMAWPIVLSVFIIILLSLFSYLNLRKQVAIEKRKKDLLSSLAIIQKPIEFDSERKILTAIYRKKHIGDCDYEQKGVDSCLKIIPKLIVVQMSANDSFKETFDKLFSAFFNSRTESIMNNSNGDNLNSSVHFLIDKKGQIYQLMPETIMARHADGVNHLSIGIAVIGFFPTKEEVRSSTLLVEYLLEKYKTILGVLAHGELKEFQKKLPEYFVEKVKTDFKVKKSASELTRLIRENLGIKDFFNSKRVIK